MGRHPFFENVERENERRALLRQAGDSLTKFRGSGDGWHLFQAFTLWREATAAASIERRNEILSEMCNPESMPSGGFEGATTELLSLNIIESLSPVIADIFEFCTLQTDDNAKLTALRDALRIGKFHAPSDTLARDAKTKCIAAWIAQYGELERTAKYVSETAIARRVGKVCNISYKTALNQWHQFLQDEPWQAQWVRQLVDRASFRKPKKIVKPRTIRTRALKPPSWR